MAESTEAVLGSLACLLRGESPSEPIAWEQVMALTRRHSVSPLLYWRLHNQNCQVAVPPAVLDTLRDDYYVAHAQNMLRGRALMRILSALDQAEVPTLLFKGVALAYSVYPEPALRLMSDIDILVRKARVECAREVLEKLGYEYQPEPLGRLNPFNTTFTSEMSFLRTEGHASTLVDLHWVLLTIELVQRATTLDLETLWARATPIEIEGATALSLSLEDQLMHTCLHLSLHGFTHLRGYADILQIIDTGRIDWDLFVSYVKQGCLRVASYFPLWWARQAWNTTVPQSVLQALKPDPLRTRLGRWMVAKAIWRKPDTGHAWNHVAQVLIVDRLSDLIKALLWLLFPGPTWLQERYRLCNRWQAWAWMVVHPMVVLWEGLRSIVTLAVQIVRRV